MKRESTGENKLITSALNDIDKNISFPQNINFHLNILKGSLNLPDPSQEILNAREIMNQGFREKIEAIIPRNINNEVILSTLGDIFYHLTRIFSNAKEPKISEIEEMIYQILTKVEPKNPSVVILIKDYETILNVEIDNRLDDHNFIKEKLEDLLSLENLYCNNDSNGLLLILKTILTIFTKLSEFLVDIVSEGDLQNFMKSLVSVLGATDSDKTAFTCLSIWEFLLSFENCVEYFKKINPVNLIISVLTKFKENQTALAIKSSNILLNIIDREDVEFFVNALKCKNYEAFTELVSKNEKNSGLVTDKSHFEIFKNNITRIFILLSKEKKFFLILKELNSLDTFVLFLKQDFEYMSSSEKKEKNDELINNTILPEFNLVMSLIENYNFTNISYNLINDITKILFHSMKCFIDNEKIITSIFDFLTKRERDLHITSDTKIAQNYESVFSSLLCKYYLNVQIPRFLSKIPLVCFYPELPVSNSERNSFNSFNSRFNSGIKDALTLIESILIIFSDEKVKSILSILNCLSLQLILGSELEKGSNFGVKALLNKNSFQLFCKLCVSLISNYTQEDFIYNKKDEENNLCQVLTFIFSGCENEEISEGIDGGEEKINIISMLLKEIQKKKLGNNSLYYLVLRIHRLIEKKSEFFGIFQKEFLFDFIFSNIQTEYEHQNEKIRQNFLKFNLEILIEIFRATDKTSLIISQFLRKNGIIYLVKLGKKNKFNFTVTKNISLLISLLSTKYFKESAILFQNLFSLKTFIKEFEKDIQFSMQKINEKIYLELLIYLKNIVKSCGIYDLCEDSDFIQYLVKEAEDIFKFCCDSTHKTFQVLFEIFSLISLNKKTMKFLFCEKFNELFFNVITQIRDCFDLNQNGILTSLSIIITSLFKSKDDAKIAYGDQTWKNILTTMNEVIESNFSCIKDIIQILEMYQTIIRFEYNELSKDKIMTIDFFNSLKSSLNERNVNYSLIESTIDTCILLIEDPNSSKIKQTAFQENSNLIAELKQFAKSERKNAIVLKRDRMRDSNFSHGSGSNPDCGRNTEYSDEKDNGDKESEEIEEYQSRKSSLINLSKNPNLQAKFERICIKLSSTIEIVNEKTLNNEKIIYENEEINELIKLIKMFAKEHNNITKIYDSGLISKIISILDNPLLSDSTLCLCCDFISYLVQYDDYVKKLLEDARTCEYFLCEFEKMSQVNNSKKKYSEYEKCKYNTITKTIAVLSSDKSFVTSNESYLNEQKVLKDLIFISKNSTICISLLTILNNVGAGKPQEDQIFERKGMILMKIWSMYPKDNIVIDCILTIIESNYKDDNFTYDLMINDLVTKMEILLRAKNIDSNLIYHCINIIDLLMSNKYFIGRIGRKEFFQTIIENGEKNIFNTKILDKFLSFIFKAILKEKSYITLFEKNQINLFCMKVLEKYLVTCHSNLLSSTMEIIFILLNEEQNYYFFSKKDNLDILIKAFKANLKTKEQVLISLKLFNFLTEKQVTFGNDKRKDGELANQNYDYDTLCDIATDIYLNYGEHFNIVFQLCSMIKSIFTFSPKPEIKKTILSILLQCGTNSVKKNQIEHVELFLQILFDIAKSGKGKSYLLDGASVLYFINEILKQMSINKQLLLYILSLLKAVIRDDLLKKSSNIREIFKALTFIEKNTQVHDERIITYFSKILALICENTKAFSEMPNHFLLFLIKYLSDSIDSKKEKEEGSDKEKQNSASEGNSKHRIEILNSIKSIAVYTRITDKAESQNAAVYLYRLFTYYKTLPESKYLINIFQIISSLIIQSTVLKHSLNSPTTKIFLSLEIQKLLDTNNFKEQLVEYQAKGCLLNLKIKTNEIYMFRSSVSQNDLIHKSLPSSHSQYLQAMDLSLQKMKVDPEMINFLTEERCSKLYLNDGTVIKVFMKMELDKQSQFTQIIAYVNDRNGIKVIQSMKVEEMESCVRSASTAAFKKAKGFFTKKPKPAKCFTILGIKNFKEEQKSFNIECEDETVCIRYVDYISGLITNKRISTEQQ